VELLERHIAKENNVLLPMLPEKLSSDLTSLHYHEDRSALIIEMVIGDGGVIQDATI
jgi:exoribonuclease-2